MPIPRFPFRLTQDEFTHAVEHLRLGESSLDIAREALVDQATLSDLEAAYGKSPKQIEQIVQRVYDEWNRKASSARVPSDVFEKAIAGRARLSAQSIEIARRALVDGEANGVLAEEYGITATRVNKIVRDINANCAKATVASLLTEQQFLEAVTGRRFTEQSQQIAYAVLVRGESMPELTRATGKSRQWIHKAVKAVHDAFLARENVPPGWVTETVTAPKDMLTEFRAAVEKQRKAYFKDRN